MGCFSGCLMSTASDQKLFCKLCSPFCCSFDEFVEEKVISPSYSSAILTPPSVFPFEDTLFGIYCRFTNIELMGNRSITLIWMKFCNIYFLHKTHHSFPALRNIRKHFNTMLWDHFKQQNSVQSLSHVQLFATPWTAALPGFPVHHQLQESTQTHVHQVNDAIQQSHLLSSPSPPALNLSQHQGLFQWVSSSHQVFKVLGFQLQHQRFQWTPRTDLL